MRGDRLLKTFLAEHLAPVHRARVACVLSGVVALVRGGELMLSRLGRSIATSSKVKHGIKRVDRLYGNSHLQSDRLHFYRGIAYGVLRGHRRPIVIVDWTEAGGGMRVLAAAVPFSGRAVTIYAEAHPLRYYANPRVEAAFLRRLREVLPRDSRPIIVTDAGFRAPWLRKVLAMNWDYLGRVRGRSKVCPIDGGKWRPFHELYPLARLRAEDLGLWRVARYQPVESRLILVRKRRPQWRAHHRRRWSQMRVRGEVEGGREPWLLATSIADLDAAHASAIYAKRMQIEESFRDAKSRRFGWALEEACTRRAERVDVMVLLAALASLLALMLGIAAEAAGLQRSFQANTLRSRRVLALTTLGRLVLLHGQLQSGCHANSNAFTLPPALAPA
jgi:hypothetical protein